MHQVTTEMLMTYSDKRTILLSEVSGRSGVQTESRAVIGWLSFPPLARPFSGGREEQVAGSQGALSGLTPAQQKGPLLFYTLQRELAEGPVVQTA
jgi:hypothetical protein